MLDLLQLVGYAVVVVMISLVTGRCLMAKLAIPFDAAWAATTVGFAVLGNCMVALLLVGQFNRPALVALALLVLIGAGLAGQLRPAQKSTTQPCLGLSRLELILAALFACILIWLSLYPYRGFDFRTYQFPMALGYAQNGGWQLFPDLRFPTFPPLMNLWFGSAILFAGDGAAASAQLLALLPLFLLVALAIRWARDLGGQVPMWAGALLLGGPVAVWAGSFGFVDVGMTLFICAALYALQRSEIDVERSRQWLVVSGALVGSAMNVKYLGGFFAPFGCFWLVARSLLPTDAYETQRRPRVRRLGADLLAFSLPLLAVALPWYLKTWQGTGNPVFPFAKSLFGLNEYGWTLELTPATTVRRVTEVVAEPARWDSYNPWMYPAIALALLSLLRTIARWRKHRSTPSPGAGSPRSTALLEVAGLSYFAFAVLLNQDHRYALPAVTLFSILGAVYFAKLLNRVEQVAQTKGVEWGPVFRLATHRTLLALVFVALGSAFLVKQAAEREFPPPLPDDYEEYLQRNHHGLAALRWAQARQPRAILQTGLEELSTFSKQERYLGTQRSPYSMRALLLEADSKDAVAEQLSQWQVDLVLEELCGLSTQRAGKRAVRELNYLRVSGESEFSSPKAIENEIESRVELVRSLLTEVQRIDGACVYKVNRAS